MGLDRSFGQAPISVDQQASFLLRALSFDRNLKKRSPDGIHIAVIYQGDGENAHQVAEAFNRAGEAGIRGLAVKATAIPFQSVGKILSQVDAEDINIIYIHSSIERGLSSIQQVTRGKKVPSLSGSKTLVEMGASVGVYILNGAPKIAINLRASKIEGLAFGAGILGVSTVIK